MTQNFEELAKQFFHGRNGAPEPIHSQQPAAGQPTHNTTPDGVRIFRLDSRQVGEEYLKMSRQLINPDKHNVGIVYADLSWNAARMNPAVSRGEWARACGTLGLQARPREPILFVARFETTYPIGLDRASGIHLHHKQTSPFMLDYMIAFWGGAGLMNADGPTQGINI